MICLKSGKLIIISAPSGCGKTTIVERLLSEHPALKRSISYTTRAPRPGEENGRDYFFVTKEDFLEKKKNNFFIESAEVFGEHYGTSKEFVINHISNGDKVVLAIDVQGMKQIKAQAEKVPMVSIFIMPPSLTVLRKRLESRNTETKEKIDERLRIAEKEMADRTLYDFIIVNQEVSEAVTSIKGIVK